ncbi:MAG: aminotransferase class I/II-fold pyridoxal phosphate-dependent enzyme [Asticcacaulis sp.]
MSNNTPSPKTGILDIAPYIGGKSKIDGIAEPIKLSSNENALGCSPKAAQAFSEAQAKLFRYPEGHANALREAGSQPITGWKPNASSSATARTRSSPLLNQVYLEAGDNIVTGEHGFLAYRISALACQGRGQAWRPSPTSASRSSACLALVDERTRIVYISNPANPTGTWNTPEEIRSLASAIGAAHPSRHRRGLCRIRRRTHLGIGV